MIQLSKMVKSYILIFIGFLCLLALPVNSLELAENIQFNKCSPNSCSDQIFSVKRSDLVDFKKDFYCSNSTLNFEKRKYYDFEWDQPPFTLEEDRMPSALNSYPKEYKNECNVVLEEEEAENLVKCSKKLTKANRKKCMDQIIFLKPKKNISISLCENIFLGLRTFILEFGNKINCQTLIDKDKNWNEVNQYKKWDEVNEEDMMFIEDKGLLSFFNRGTSYIPYEEYIKYKTNSKKETIDYEPKNVTWEIITNAFPPVGSSYTEEDIKNLRFITEKSHQISSENHLQNFFYYVTRQAKDYCVRQIRNKWTNEFICKITKITYLEPEFPYNNTELENKKGIDIYKLTIDWYGFYDPEKIIN